VDLAPDPLESSSFTSSSSSSGQVTAKSKQHELAHSLNHQLK
jgi:hypothetical protein